MVNSYDDMAGSNEDVSDHKFTSSDNTHVADVVQFPISMKEADYNRLLSGVILKRGGNPNTGKGPAKILRGPGSND